jgi:hypothetical protein
MWSPHGGRENVAVEGRPICAKTCEITGNIKPISVVWSFEEEAEKQAFDT